MKDKVIKLILGLVQAYIDFSIIFLALAIFTIAIGGACCLISPQSVLGKPLTLDLVIQGIVIIALALLVFFGLLAAHQLLDNLNRAEYFVLANCLALRKILYITTIGTALSGTTTIWLHLSHIKPLTNLIIITESSFDDNLAFIIILLIIYLIFQRGIALQDDADSII